MYRKACWQQIALRIVTSVVQNCFRCKIDWKVCEKFPVSGPDFDIDDVDGSGAFPALQHAISMDTKSDQR